MEVDFQAGAPALGAAGSSLAASSTSSTLLRGYYQTKIDELEANIREKQENLRRLEAQRNDLNSKGKW